MMERFLCLDFGDTDDSRLPHLRFDRLFRSFRALDSEENVAEMVGGLS